MNVLLRVADATRSLNFYRALGFSEQLLLSKDGRLYFGEMVVGDARNGALMFLERDWWTFDVEGPAIRDGAGQVVYLPVDNVDAVRAKLPASAIAREPRDEYYGREMLVRDPDGHQIAVFKAYAGGERLPEGVTAWRRQPV